MLTSAVGRTLRSPSGVSVASVARTRVSAVARPVGRKSSTNTSTSTSTSSTPPPAAGGPSEGGGGSRGRGAYKVTRENQKQRVYWPRILLEGKRGERCIVEPGLLQRLRTACCTTHVRCCRLLAYIRVFAEYFLICPLTPYPACDGGGPAAQQQRRYFVGGRDVPWSPDQLSPRTCA